MLDLSFKQWKDLAHVDVLQITTLYTLSTHLILNYFGAQFQTTFVDCFFVF